MNEQSIAEMRALMNKGLIGTNEQKLEFVELNAADLDDSVLEKFDCGNEDITEYLKKYAKEDVIFT